MLLNEFISNIQDLPTLPAVAAEINREVQDENLSAESLALIIGNDPSLTSKVMRLANSAYYGLVKQVDTLDRAITVLGFNTIKNLALTVSVFKIFQNDGRHNIDMEGLWHHSMGCAVASKSIAANISVPMAEQAFLCGLIHDIGKIAIAQTMPEKMSEIIAMTKDSFLTQSELEQESLGFTHQQIGALLAEKWNFPEQHCKAIKLHHTPYTLRTEIDFKDSVLISSVYVGNQIAKAMSLGASTDPRAVKIGSETWQGLKIARDKIAEFRDQIKEDYDAILQSWELE